MTSSAPPPRPPYTFSVFKRDLLYALRSRPGVYSNRALGDSSKRALWTDAKLLSLYNGITTSHSVFFSKELKLSEYARLIIAECMQESTGDYNLNVHPISFTDHRSQGIIQVTPGSVLIDYKKWGMPVPGTTLHPDTIQKVDLSDPGVCIVIWAWYTKNCVQMKMSMNEYANKTKWNSQASEFVVQDIGNCMFTWLGGPRSDRTNDPKGFEDYYLRILDYFVQSKFGSKNKFDALIARRISPGIVCMNLN
jgi:hypothetical protein